jgi:hypothetical protein
VSQPDELFGGLCCGVCVIVKTPLAGVGALLLAMTTSGCVVVGSSSSQSDSGGAGFLFLLVPVFLLFGVFRLISRSRRSTTTYRSVRRSADHTDERDPSVSMLRAELSVLSDDVLRLEPQITLVPAARDDYEAALHRYRVAQMALDTTEAVDLVRVQRVVDEASWSMARARAILDGRPAPALPDRLQHQGTRGEPAVNVDAGNNPRYVGSPASFQSGWFTAGPGLFGGLLIGSILGGGFGGWAEETEPNSGDWDAPIE